VRCNSNINPKYKRSLLSTFLGEYIMVIFTSKILAVSSILVLASLTSVPAAADTSKVDYSNATNFESVKSRDQVRGEYFQAMKEGSLAKAGDTEVDADSPALAKAAPSNLQRQDVYAATVEWMRATQSSEIGMGE
jgi:hypothetical protein